MKRSSWSALALGMCLVCGAARAGAEGDGKRGTQVWLEPTWGVVLPLFSLNPRGPLPGTVLYVPVGVNVPLGGRSSLGFELSYLNRRWISEFEGTPLDHRTDALRLSVGPVFQLSGERPYEGFFVQPLVTATFVSRYEDVYMSYGRQVDRWKTSAVALEAGVDVGYGYRWGNFTVTPLIGVSMGYSSRASSETGLDWLWVLGSGPEREGPRVVWNLNLDLLRLGWVF